MLNLPKLTTATDFTIDEVTRKPGTSGEFNVTLRLVDSEQRTLVVHYEVLLDFAAFRAAALHAANVLLRHPAEERASNGKSAWLELICEPIKRSMTKQHS